MCMCVCSFVCVRVCVRTFVCEFSCASVRVFMCMCVLSCVSLCVCACVSVFVCVQCSVRREGTCHYFSFQPFSRPLSMLSTHNTYQNDPQGIPINVIIMISHHVSVR